MNNKKTLTNFMILTTIVTIFSLIILLYVINSQSQVADIKSRELACQVLFKGITSTDTFFSSARDSPTEQLSNSIVETCASQKVEINSKSMKSAINLINSCYRKTAKGEDIFKGTNVRNQAICLYCGEIKAVETIEDFNKKFDKEVKLETNKHLFSKDTEFQNTNKYFLSENYLPKKIEEGESISVFYYIFRPNFNEAIDSKTGQIETVNFVDFASNKYQEDLSKFFFSYNGFGESIGDLISEYGLSSSTKSLGGIVMSKQRKLDEDNFIEDKINLEGPFEECFLNIPLKHFD